MKNELKSSLKPLYQELLLQVKSEKDLHTFCIQWGENFPRNTNEGILFIGKATNGWVSNSNDITVLFGNDTNQIFDRHDQMNWVKNHEGKKYKYNTKKSAFWRVIKKTSQKLLDENDIFSKIAWSNLYKMSYSKGNPSKNLKKNQVELCKKILEVEIKILSPKFIVFLTSGWENEFLKYLNNDITPTPIKTIEWNGKYLSKLFIINKQTYITTQHPQGKDERMHVKALFELMQFSME